VTGTGWYWSASQIEFFKIPQPSDSC